MNIIPRYFFLLLTMLLLAWSVSEGAFAEDGPPPIVVGLTAEFGVEGSHSAQSIEKGVALAIDEINRAGGVLGGRRLVLETRDDRGVPARGIDNFIDFAARPEVIAVFGSRFSPVVIEIAPLAARHGLMLLAPWSAADAITRQPSPNYVFRLSMIDTWAMDAMLNEVRKRRFRHVALFVPNTAWGRSNEAAFLAGTKRKSSVDHHTYWYNWGDTEFKSRLKQARAAGAQALIMVANEFEGVPIVKQMAALPESERMPILAHWGLLAGDFAKATGGALEAVDFSVAHTFSFQDTDRPQAQAVAAGVKRLFNLDVRNMRAQVGFAHAYDLTHLLAKAIRKAGSTDRRAVRNAMERLDEHEGLVRRYATPFTPARHEALDARDVSLARFDKDGNLRSGSRK